MAESTFSYGLSDFRDECCFEMGYGATYSSASSDQQNRVDRAIKAGERLFVFPPSGHNWSFLYPTDTLTTVADDDDYTMDDDFLGILGPMKFQTSDNRFHMVLKASASKIRQLWMTNQHGPPQLFAVEPIESGQTTGQRYQVIFWPMIDAAWTLTFRKYIAYSGMTTAKPYMPGGAQFAETQMQCVLAGAEKIKTGKWGANYSGPGGALELLKAAELRDQREEPEFYGYMRDPGTIEYPNLRYTQGRTVTYNGTDVDNL